MKTMLTENLKICRDRKGWSQIKAAKKIGVSNSTYRGWEEGRRIPSEVIPAVALAFETSVSALLGMRQEANEELAQAILCLEDGFEHIKKALAKL